MRGLEYFSWSCIVAFATAAFEGHIYLSESHPRKDAAPPSLSPNTARLLLAQRLGLAEYHELGDTVETELSVLNEYGGSQQALFAPRQESAGKLLIVEGVLHPSDLFNSERSVDLLVPAPPQSSATTKLALDLQTQKDHQQGAGRSSNRAIRYVTSLRDLGRTNPSYATNLSKAKSLVQSHLASKNINTLLITPPFIHTSATSSYGYYPPPAALLSRREAPPSESVLSEGSAATSTTPTVSSTESTSSPQLPHGIPPVCHPTLEKLVSSTNNCSGHGTPYKKSSKGMLDDDSADCYACKCHSTSSKNDEGKTQTTKWGGAACQKKDYSMQFWLLAGLSIALIAVTGWGIGLLVSVGNEELPGVIGAGVAGPRAQK